MDRIEEKCFNEETVACYERSYLMDLDSLSLLWVLVVGCQYVRDGGIIGNEDADKLLQKLWKNKHFLIENKFPNDFFSQDAETFAIEAKGLVSCPCYTWKVRQLPPYCQSIIGILAEYIRRSQYPAHAKMSHTEALRRISEIQNKFVNAEA